MAEKLEVDLRTIGELASQLPSSLAEEERTQAYADLM